MNKKLYTIAVLSSTLFLSGCFNKTATITSEQTPSEALSEWQKMGAAIENGDPVRCEMTHLESNTVSQYYMQGEKVRFDSVNSSEEEGASGSFLSDGKVVYSWNTILKEGVMFSIQDPELPDAQTSQVDAPDLSSEEDWNRYRDEGYSFVCTVEQLPENIFTPPTDVTFMDMNQINKQMQLQMDSGTGDQAVPSQEEINSMMEQYSQMGQ